ncbi:MAG: hypothetical protein A2Y94_11725 [Caldithrix sp. RBG_13_44_9]|nr:MAG: hypothetical protein A2Y94_11725 [Caldithrix sp. RBG_13_44_9]
MTQLKFGLPAAGEVELIIWNIQGRKICELLRKKLSAGEYQVSWNAENLPSGIYLLDLRVLDATNLTSLFKQTRKIILLK